MSTTAPRTALLFLSFGGPNKADEVVPFLENVTRGRGIPRERLEHVGEHYFTLGGRSPINEQNLKIIENLEQELRARDLDLPVYFGNRNWEPYVEDTLLTIARDGIEHVYVFATSAWGGYSGCGQYQEDIRRALTAVTNAGEQAPTIERLPQFHSHPAFIASFAAAVDAARTSLGDKGTDAELIFTAHSVPNVADAAAGPHSFGGNLYSQQVLDAARLVQQASSFANQPGSFADHGWTGRLARHEPVGGRGDGPAHTGIDAGVDCGVGTPLDVETTWQSRSGSPHVPWLEPDICDHIEARAAAGNTRGIVLCPIGFITDHIEVMWDLDTEAQEAADNAGIPFVRVATPGLTPEFAAMIVDLVEECRQPGNALLNTDSTSTVSRLESSQIVRSASGIRTEAQQAAADLVAQLGTVPDFGHTLNGRPCAPGCCGTDKALFD
ncbi:ferrochelatase [Corynebacterium sp. 320]|uniref:ferrochelatase n=1 Tax=Corynebacterium TaxID=1716 RepID=UPI00125CABE9|nr:MULTISPECIES: ferrochelatase [Corynebacterium]KAB1502861.1 ferrochelatase [Corynebacterium sp. 320]KAB1552372.1 ferrochelatase [Corynebacterium sp. 321]KAB1554413.1 ferrochelatase [Corynebacterium sp. 319]KAB3526524.1 ferrochelatase [Corynebacterium sp. 250]KAB3539844.1 ferrochelatase [Corynebacterium sp. 366]